MILLDKPYVSKFLVDTINENSIPIVQTGEISDLIGSDLKSICNDTEAINYIKTNIKTIRLYTNSENAIHWINENLTFCDIPDKIDLFKDKVKFRSLVQDMYPNFYFREVKYEELDSFDFDSIPKPFIIKPAVGFFSMSVHRVDTLNEWGIVRRKIKNEVENTKQIYPQDVVNTNRFIIEEFIKGEEFAIDAYFNSTGKAVIVGLLKHMFSTDTDVSDRIYLTSKKHIQKHLDTFQSFIQEIGTHARLTNFPMHIEVRINDKGKIIPIEINPMRFGGWCTTADLTAMAFGFNPYLYFLNNKSPDWKSIISSMNNSIFSLIILDNSTGFQSKNIDCFDYEKALKKLKHPLELRPVKFKEYPLFGIVFTITEEDNYQELEYFLKSDLREYIITK